MIRNSITLFTMCLLSVKLFSQNTDTLVDANKHRVAVTIIEITTTEVLYKLPNKLDLPLFHVKRNALSEIILKDGSAINPKFNSINPYDKIEYPKAKSIFYFTPTKLFQNHIAFAYEYIFRKNIVGIRIPVSVSFIDVTKLKPQGAFFHESDIHRTFATGIDINFYPLKLGRIKYVTGIGLQYAQFAYQYYPSYYSYSQKYPDIKIGSHYSFVINNGFISQVTKHLIISATIGVGNQLEHGQNYYDKRIRFNTTCNIGYTF